MTRPRLMRDLRARRTVEARDRLRHDLIQCARALTATKHEQPQATMATGKAPFRWNDRRDLRTHRVAGPLDFHALVERVGKRDEHLVGELPEHAVREARDRILLVNCKRPIEK